MYCVNIFIFSQTFSSTVNSIIPDNNSIISFELSVSGLPNVLDNNFGLEQICLNIEHPYDADLEVKLQAPDGTEKILFSGIGGDGDNFTGTCLDGISTSILNVSPPYTGFFSSQGFIGDINNGQNPNGIWHLLIVDMGAADIGTLIDWNITFGSNPALPFTFDSSNLPIVKLTTLADPLNNDIKVPLQMQIIDNGEGIRNYTNQTDFAYEGTIMAEWQGFSGPYYPKKNFDFQTVDELGINLDTSILNMTKEHDWIFKAEYLDLSLLKNSVAYEMERRMGNYAPNTRPCEIILDGQYVGYYTLTEKIKRDSNRVNISKLTLNDTLGSDLTGGYIIEMNINGDPADWVSNFEPSNVATACCAVEYKHVYPKSDVILPIQHDYIKNYVDSFEIVLASSNYTDPINGYEKYINLNSFIDFLIVNEFSVNYDSYGRSTYLFKNKNGKLNCGPSWDYDRAMPYDNPSSSEGWVWELTHPNWPFPFHWQRLWEDENYRKKLACRWQMLRQNTLSNESFMGLIDSLYTKVSEGAERNFTIWNGGSASYTTQVDSLKSFISRRLLWIDETLALENVNPPIFYIPSDTIFCLGANYDASFNGNQFIYSWNDLSDNSVINLTQSGMNSLKVTDQFGCYATKNMNVTLTSPNADFTYTNSAENLNEWQFTPINLNGFAYLWNFGDGNSSIEISPTNNYSLEGEYTVSLTITDSISCTNTVIDTLDLNLSALKNLNLLNWIIYPNPFQEEIFLYFNSTADSELEIKLINEFGQNLFEKNYEAGLKTIIIPTNQLSKGLYFISVSNAKDTWIQRVVKE